MKFSEMKYIRPDIPNLCLELENYVTCLRAAKTFAEADAVFHKVEELYSRVETMFSLAYVRQRINTEDDFYSAEKAYIDKNSPVWKKSGQQWVEALLDSSFRAEFAEKYGELMFRNMEIAQKAFSPDIIHELQEENRLKTEYTRLIASAQIPFEGGVYTLSQLAPFKQDTDGNRRLSAWIADGKFHKENGAALDGIFKELTKLRTEMAKKLGCEGYTELGYYRMCRNSYTKEDVKKFRKAVVEYIVPVVSEIKRQQAKRLGVSYPMNFADSALAFPSGNPKPFGMDAELAHSRRLYHELSPETGEFIDFMFDNELFDVLSRKGKAAGGFCIVVDDYRAPFVYANFNQTAHDVEVMTHETGHAFADYSLRDVFPRANRDYTYEIAETHSMSMEFLTWSWAEGFFGKDTEKFRYAHLSGALGSLPYICMVDHFQHENYEKPEMTESQRHEVWRELTGVYMPWIKLGEIPFYGDGKWWQRQTHIYERPFYYIDYALAQTVALQYWIMMRENMEEAWKSYKELIRNSGTMAFTELLAASGLESPFDGVSLQKIAETATAWLNEFDLEKLN